MKLRDDTPQRSLLRPNSLHMALDPGPSSLSTLAIMEGLLSPVSIVVWDRCPSNGRANGQSGPWTAVLLEASVRPLPLLLSHPLAHRRHAHLAKVRQSKREGSELKGEVERAVGAWCGSRRRGRFVYRPSLT